MDTVTPMFRTMPSKVSFSRLIRRERHNTGCMYRQCYDSLSKIEIGGVAGLNAS
jgi:hypothetical protein